MDVIATSRSDARVFAATHGFALTAEFNHGRSCIGIHRNDRVATVSANCFEAAYAKALEWMLEAIDAE